LDILFAGKPHGMVEGIMAKPLHVQQAKYYGCIESDGTTVDHYPTILASDPVPL
jgi:hypothetical protein